MGNHEDFFLKRPKSVDHYEWVREELSAEQIQWLGERPVFHDFNLSGRKIRLCHAGPANVHHRVYPLESRKKKQVLFDPIDTEDRSPDVLGYGDVHWAYIEYFDACRTLFNCGSVGNSMDLPLASFALLSGTPSAQTDAPSEHIENCAPFSIQFYRVPYDIEKEIRVTEKSAMPLKGKAIYIEEIRTGTWGKRWSRHT